MVTLLLEITCARLSTQRECKKRVNDNVGQCHDNNIDYNLIILIITVYATVTLLPIAAAVAAIVVVFAPALALALALAVLHVFTCVRTGTRPTKNIRGFMKTSKAWSVFNLLNQNWYGVHHN